ncbi:MAG: protein phosphatase 2C domain-containing protein [Pirellulales bacterium]|nr:protein phosphatase 2C domain-containing protein [Pirellulales bacterium]
MIDCESADQARLYFDEDMSEPALIPIAGGISCLLTSRCPDKETPNEDAAALIPVDGRSAVLVVADGLGGGAAGEHASRKAIESLKLAIDDARGTETLLRTAIISGFELANQAVQDLGVGAATTLAVVEVVDGVVRSYHVGDSTVLVVGGLGKIKQQTVSHSPVGYGVEAGLLDEAEAMHHEERHIVSNVIGSPEMHIAVGPPIALSPRDSVLLASDGLCDNLDWDSIIHIIRKGRLSQSIMALAKASTDRMNHHTEGQPSKPDDLTLIAFRLSRSRH